MSLLAPTTLRPADLHLMVWDIGSCLGRVAPAHVESTRNGIVRLRVGRELLLIGEDEIEDRVRLGREARVWEQRERARGGGR